MHRPLWWHTASRALTWIRRLVARWWPAGYLGLCGFDIAGAWQSHWPHDAKIQTTLIVGTLATWFVLWRSERTMRRVAQLRLGENTLPCAVCHHYACEGDLCSSCEGPCATLEEQRKRFVQPELNGHGGI